MSTPPRGEPESPHRRDDEFQRLWGSGRGVDAAAAREQLAVTERELVAAQAALKSLRMHNDTLDHEVRTLSANVANLDAELRAERHTLAGVQYDRDCARYAAVRAGVEDPLSGAEPDHQGVWTPGRPYLANQHVYDRETGSCFVADISGVRARRPPRKGSRCWEECEPDSHYPVPPPLPSPDDGQHPLASGLALRQSRWWYDAERKRWSIEQSDDPDTPALSREQLLAVLGWLEVEDNLQSLWNSEARRVPPLVPCPPNAYEHAHDWLDDLPLPRALLAEKRRRGIRFGSGDKANSTKGGWTWGDHPF